MDFGYQAAGRLEMLPERTKRCRCKYCGDELKLKSIIFNEFVEARVEIYCEHCRRIEYGVEKEIYQSAAYFVDELGFNAFPNQEASESTRRMNIAEVCEIMAWGNKHLGFLGDDGFKFPPDTQNTTLGETVIFKDSDL